MNKSSVIYIEPKNGQYKFDLPEMCYFDTSFINEMYGNNTDEYTQKSCRIFTKKLVENGTYLSISGIVLDELSHVIRGRYVKEKLGNDNSNQKDIEKYINEHPESQIEIVKEIRRVQDELMKAFVYLDYHHSENFDNLALNVMELYGLNSRDARHVTLSLSHQINSIATVDSGFAKTDNLNIYTPNKRIVTSCLDRPNIYIPPNKMFYESLKIIGSTSTADVSDACN